jgi:hypothetical protein
MKRSPWGRKFLAGLSVVGFAVLSIFSYAVDEPKDAETISTPAGSGLYLKVQLAGPVKMSKLKPGEVVEGKLTRDVYSADRELFPAGSSVRVTVDHLEKRRRPKNDHWPWAINMFTPRHENYPAFKSGTVSGAGGDSTLQVSLISVSRRREVHAKAKGSKAGQQSGQEGSVDVGPANSKKLKAPVMILEASGISDSSVVVANKSDNGASESASSEPQTLPAGMRCKILLLGDVSASKSKPGDAIQARLLEPVFLNSHVVLPAGSLFEGKVIRKTPPRWLSRAGSLYLTFTGLTLPEGDHIPIAASLAGAELDRLSHTRMDAEGQLHGERPGKAWMAINLGVTAGIAKEVDDGLQLVIEAIVSTATDVSTAGTARIVASCASGLYMVTRHGRDVVLPRFTEMDISLDRAVSLKPAPGDSVGAAGGK